MNELRKLFLNHQGKISDKWSLYINDWDQVFSPFRDKKINLMEIGVQNGGSLEVWSKYFSKAENIIGCDINEKCDNLEFDDPRISMITGDINSNDVEEKISNLCKELDILIDDGSHKSSDIIQSFSRYFKKVSDNGIYIIEDLHTSYWKEYEGGLYEPYSAMAFLKRLSDIVNFEHWRNGKYRIEYIAPYIKKYNLNLKEIDLYSIHSIEFINSLCIIYKSPPENNSLGKRLVVGSDEKITQDWKKLNGTSIQDTATQEKNDSHLDLFTLLDEEEKDKQTIQSLNAQLVEREQTIQSLNPQLVEKEQTIQALKTQLVEREQSIQSLNAQLAEKDQSIQYLNAQLAEKEQTIQSLNAQIVDKDQSIQSLNAQLAEKDKTIQSLNAQLAEKEQTIQSLNAQLAEKEQTIQSLNAQLAEKEQTIQSLNAQIVDKDQSIQSLNAQLAEKDKTIQSLNAQLAESQNEVLYYALSKSWRITRPLRKIMKLFRGKNND